MGLIVLVIVLAIVLFVVLSSVKVVNTGYLYVVERLGQFSRYLSQVGILLFQALILLEKKFQLNNKF